MHIALSIEYDGSHFHGWQVQPNLRTVQAEVEKALSKVADEPIQVYCAGRTDTGVHATGQVVHFDTQSERGGRAWIYGVNSNLPKDVCVRWAKVVDEAFHARYSAISRRYRYFIYNHPIRPSIMNTNLSWQYRPLDDKRMAQAAKYLLGEHDFSSFRAVGCQAKSPVKTIRHFNVIRQGDLIILDVIANSFLHHMVRNLVGALMTIGSGRQNVDWIKELLKVRDRDLSAETAPPYGLYLVAVKYDEQFDLPQSSMGPFFYPSVQGME